MVQARYQYAIDVMLTRLRMIDADLTEKNERPLIRNLCSRIKTAESIVKKLERKEREVTFETLYHCQRKKLYKEAEKKRLSKPSSDRGSAGNLSG